MNALEIEDKKEISITNYVKNMTNFTRKIHPDICKNNHQKDSTCDHNNRNGIHTETYIITHSHNVKHTVVIINIYILTFHKW